MLYTYSIYPFVASHTAISATSVDCSSNPIALHLNVHMYVCYMPHNTYFIYMKSN